MALLFALPVFVHDAMTFSPNPSASDDTEAAYRLVAAATLSRLGVKSLRRFYVWRIDRTWQRGDGTGRGGR